MNKETPQWNYNSVIPRNAPELVPNRRLIDSPELVPNRRLIDTICFTPFIA